MIIIIALVIKIFGLILLPFIFKGLIVLLFKGAVAIPTTIASMVGKSGATLASKSLAGASAKGLLTILQSKGFVMLFIKSVFNFGLVWTIKLLAITSIMVGGIQWTYDRIKYMQGFVEAVQQGNTYQAIVNLRELARSFYGVDLDGIANLPNDIDNYLAHIGADFNTRTSIKTYIVDNLDNISISSPS